MTKYKLLYVSAEKDGMWLLEQVAPYDCSDYVKKLEKWRGNVSIITDKEYDFIFNILFKNNKEINIGTDGLDKKKQFVYYYLQLI